LHSAAARGVGPQAKGGTKPEATADRADNMCVQDRNCDSQVIAEPDLHDGGSLPALARVACPQPAVGSKRRGPERIVGDPEAIQMGTERSLAIGLAFLAVSIAVGDFVANRFKGSSIAEIVRESFLIGDWVPMWRPLEVFLYDWWPIRNEAMRMRLALSITAIVLLTPNLGHAQADHHHASPETLGSVELLTWDAFH